jgi:pentatricopeptide repeat protein
MKNKHGIDPWLLHYGCMVDLYGRAGRLDDAINFINAMPVEPHEGVWGALLKASRIHKNVELGKTCIGQPMAMESGNSAAHVLFVQHLCGVTELEGHKQCSGHDEGQRSEEGAWLECHRG